MCFEIKMSNLHKEVNFVNNKGPGAVMETVVMVGVLIQGTCPSFSHGVHFNFYILSQSYCENLCTKL